MCRFVGLGGGRFARGDGSGVARGNGYLIELRANGGDTPEVAVNLRGLVVR